MSDTLDCILEKVKAKGKLVLNINECCMNSEGNTREAYCAVIENELMSMMRLIDMYKTEICKILGDVSENALLRGSLFPNLSNTL